MVLAATELTSDDDIAALVAGLEGGAEMSLNTQGRPTAPGEAGAVTAKAALLPDEPLLFEIGDTRRNRRRSARRRDRRARVSAASPARRRSICPASPSPRRCATMCGCRRLNYSIDSGMYPLGSCTMKHNPRLNEKTARLPGFADIHPLQPVSTVQGALGADRGAGRLADDADQHVRRRAEPQGRRAWRIVRHDGDQGRAGGARAGAPQRRARPRKRARHQSGDGRLPRL